MSTLEKDVIDIVVEQLGVDAADVTLDKSFIEDLNADSLDLTELIMTFEERFGFEISEEEAEKLKTVGDIVESTLVTDVSPASVGKDTNWIKPGRASWSWLFDHDSPQDCTKLKTWVDLAAAMGWEYSLVDANWDIMKQFEYPNRFGFPVFVVLDGKGKLLHTQDSGLLEQGKGYDTTKVVTFLKQWNVKALNPATYKE